MALVPCPPQRTVAGTGLRTGAGTESEMRNPGAYKPSGSFADFSGGKAVNRIRGYCEMCGTGIGRRGSRTPRFCMPCTDMRAQERYTRLRRARRQRRGDGAPA
jgi:hypothetical protein